MCQDILTTQYMARVEAENGTEPWPFFGTLPHCTNPSSGPALLPDSLPEHLIGAWTDGSSLGLSTTGYVRALYVPANFRVDIRPNFSQNAVSVQGPKLIDADGGESLLVTDYVGFGPRTLDKIPIHSLEFKISRTCLDPTRSGSGCDWKWDNLTAACAGHGALTVLGVPFNNLTPHRPGCDGLMEEYCRTPAAQDDVLCSCFQEADVLAKKYPGFSFPTLCGGQTCGSVGYPTEKMVQRGCTVTLCESILKQNGTNLYNQGHSTIYCAGTLYQTDTGTAVPPDTRENTAASSAQNDPNATRDTGVPYFYWIILALSVLLSVGLSYLVYTRTYSHVYRSSVRGR